MENPFANNPDAQKLYDAVRSGKINFDNIPMQHPLANIQTGIDPQVVELLNKERKRNNCRWWIVLIVMVLTMLIAGLSLWLQLSGRAATLPK